MIRSRPTSLHGQALLVCLLCASTAPALAQTFTPDPIHAEEAYVNGARLLDRKDLPAAQKEFARAATLDPTHSEYARAMALTREHRVTDLIQQAAKARLGNHDERAELLLAQARVLDPLDERVLEHQNASAAPPSLAPQITPGKNLAFAPPIVLDPQPGLKDLHFRGDTRQVVTQVAQEYGIKVAFDDSVTSLNLRFDLEQTPYQQAMPIVLHMAHLFAVPLDTKTLIVSKDTEENRNKYERQVEESIYIPASTTEQINELVNIIKQVFDIKQVAVVPGSGTIAIRAPKPTIEAVNYTLADMIDGGSEVVLEIKLVTVDKSLTRDIGINPPTSGSAFSAASEVQSFVAANQSTIATAISSGAFTPSGSAAQQLIEEAAFLILSGLATDAKLTNVISYFGNGLTLFGASISGGATLNFALNSSDSHALDDINVRMGDRQTSTLRIGQKYPVTTATYSSGLSSAATSALSRININGVSAASLAAQVSSVATVPQVQFEDLGITLKTTPTCMRSNLIRLDIDMKVEALTGSSLNGIPVLTSSVYTSNITVPDGNTVVMLSNMSSAESASVSGLPGLGELPGFNETLSEKYKTTSTSELILLITPRLVRHRKNALSSRAIPLPHLHPAGLLAERKGSRPTASPSGDNPLIKTACAAFILLALPAAAQHVVLPLWPKGNPEPSKVVGPEIDPTTDANRLVSGKVSVRITNVSEPTLTVFQPAPVANTGAAALVFPGGGYVRLSWNLEGTEVCDWLNSIGMSCILVKYRVPEEKHFPDNTEDLEDAQQAMRLTRDHAAERHLDPARVGVVGFSAGAHLAAVLSTHPDFQAATVPPSTIDARPSFQMLLYPGYLTTPEGKLNPSMQPNPQLPPTFLVMAENDYTAHVENALGYFQALKDAKIPAELHLFTLGGHGFGLRATELPISRWPALAAEWLHSIHILGPPAPVGRP